MSNPKVASIAEGILEFLKSQNAVELLPEIISELQNRHRTDNLVRVESAVPLQPSDRLDISRMLGEQYQVTGPVEFSVNPELVGGLRIVMGDQVIDASVRAHVEDIYAR